MPDAIVDSLRIKPCERVAEIGAGTGYFNARFARAVGPCGRTFATEITPELVEYMRNRAELESTPEVVSLLCSPEDSCLPDSLDLVFLCNTYRYIDRRRSYFARVRDHLVDSGRVAVVDFRETARDTTGWRLPSGRVIEEMQAAGFEVAERFDFLPKQYFLVFSKSRDLVE
jgi:ubiquinone/menaquinone biosynthesis C-methylase UbiE